MPSLPPPAIAAALATLTAAAAGRATVARLVLCAALAGGHVVLNDLPGTGKTTLAKALGASLGLVFQRLQGTSDLLPSDIVGVNVYQRDTGAFVFHPGPIFTHVLLCDELNRCPPRTQSALLEGMGEGQVTLDGVTHALPTPFLVIATQNPMDGQSTLALPDAQWDRFMFHLSMGPLAAEAEKALFQHPEWGRATPTPVREGPLTPPAGHAPFVALQAQSQTPHLSEALVDYLWRLVTVSRETFAERGGLSTRAGQAIARAARAWAFLEGRDYVTPEDVAAVFVPAALHRLLPGDRLHTPEAVERIAALLDRVPVRA
jgi:MoxR-like ATPase